MMQPVHRIKARGASAIEGNVVADWPKAAWNGWMLAIWLILAPTATTVGSLGVFLVATWVTLLLGHSVGMHRMMVHRSFSAPTWVEYSLIYIGVLVGMGSPSAIIRVHDLRDWAQRQKECHDFFAHRRSYLKDICWQLFGRFDFARSPKLVVEPKFANDAFYRFLDQSWRWHQLVLAIPLYAIGGLPWLVWGVCARVFVSTWGHWTITYFCHNPGPGHWHVQRASVQASNLQGLGWVTFGECWHNNHHAFPESAQIGLEPGQSDPGWLFIKLLRCAGLAYNVGQPRSEDQREDLIPQGTKTVSTASAANCG